MFNSNIKEYFAKVDSDAQSFHSICTQEHIVSNSIPYYRIKEKLKEILRNRDRNTQLYFHTMLSNRLYIQDGQFQKLSVENIDGYLDKLAKNMTAEISERVAVEVCEWTKETVCATRIPDTWPIEYYPNVNFTYEVDCDMDKTTLRRELLCGSNGKLKTFNKQFVYVWTVLVGFSVNININWF